MSEDRLDVICVIPVDANLYGINYEPSPGMIPIPCEKCNNLCWIGENQRNMKARKPETNLWCAICIAMHMKEIGQKEYTVHNLKENPI